MWQVNWIQRLATIWERALVFAIPCNIAYFVSPPYVTNFPYTIQIKYMKFLYNFDYTFSSFICL